MKAKCSPLDIISTLPLNIIENILCRVPIRDAVRTSILSRDWRYNWTRIPKLVFNKKDMFKKSTDENQLSLLEQSFAEPPSERKYLKKRCKVFYAIFQVLLVHEGPIHEFTLSMNANSTSFEIDQIILHLSKNKTLERLTLHFVDTFEYAVPFRVFLLHGLTHLDLRNCDMATHPSIFNVFCCLTSLYMENVNIDTNALLHLISKSPLLKSLTLVICADYINNHDNSNTIIELFKCLHLIEHLSVSSPVIECFSQWVVPHELPASLVCLKYLYLAEVCFIDMSGLPFLFLMIKWSPNLETIKLQFIRYPSYRIDIDSVTLKDYSDVRLTKLNILEIEYFSNLKPELEFVRLMLAKSTVLKKVTIILNDKVSKDEEIIMLRTLLCSTRASRSVKIIVERDDF